VLDFFKEKWEFWTVLTRRHWTHHTNFTYKEYCTIFSIAILNLYILLFGWTLIRLKKIPHNVHFRIQWEYYYQVLVVSLIALLHLFYTTKMLFYFFEPFANFSRSVRLFFGKKVPKRQNVEKGQQNVLELNFFPFLNCLLFPWPFSTFRWNHYYRTAFVISWHVNHDYFHGVQNNNQPRTWFDD
jgi:hypothetical protein